MWQIEYLIDVYLESLQKRKNKKPKQWNITTANIYNSRKDVPKLKDLKLNIKRTHCILGKLRAPNTEPYSGKITESSRKEKKFFGYLGKKIKFYL